MTGPEHHDQGPDQVPEQGPEHGPDQGIDQGIGQGIGPGLDQGPELSPELTADLDADPALAAAVLEIEAHIAEGGWDQPARLYALVDTAELVEHEPALAAAMGLDAADAAGSMTPVEQDELAPDRALESVLESITWPPGVAGCAAVVERLVLPPEADAAIPEDASAAERYAREHPDRQEVRIVAGATRSGSTYCALRLRAHDEATSVVGGADLVPGLLDLLLATLDEDGADSGDGGATGDTGDGRGRP